MGVIKGILALLLVLVLWTAYLFFTPMGWHRLSLAALAVFMPPLRRLAVRAWYKDDIMINAWLGGIKGHSISGRVAYRAIKTGKLKYRVAQWIINKLFWFQADHCFVSINWSLMPAIKKGEFTTLYYASRKVKD
jgi:hypothetical protein